MPHALLIGANGFIASHLLRTLLSSPQNPPFVVTATVRSQSKVDAILNDPRNTESLLPRSRVHFVIVPDIAAPGAWDDIFSKSGDFGDVEYVLHPAAPMPDGTFADGGVGDFEEDWMKPGVDGVLEVLRAAQRHGKAVKHISITGSISNLRAWDWFGTKEKPISVGDWNPITPEQARDSDSPFLRHHAAKKFSEVAVWDFVKDDNPQFSVSVINPTMVFGPAIQPISSLDKINMTTDMLHELFSGTLAGKQIPKTYLSAYLDVRDLANAHVHALTSPSAANKRFVIGSAYYSSTRVIDTIREKFPMLANKLPTESEGDGIKAYVDDGDAGDALSLRYRSWEETIVDSVEELLKVQKTKER